MPGNEIYFEDQVFPSSLCLGDQVFILFRVKLPELEPLPPNVGTIRYLNGSRVVCRRHTQQSTVLQWRASEPSLLAVQCWEAPKETELDLVDLGLYSTS